ncbi:RlpA-like double-psi beta-barrel-protein domain-containing protein-containing protein [Suillus spraguei]|nr:RlpA-like double-psi beta-barrel-protein domain-containing protein-containing protein [Suillus spraguei]
MHDFFHRYGCANTARWNCTTSSLDKRTTHTGEGTWFEVGTGACGYTDTDRNCNQWIYITNTANGQTAYGKTRDECESCGSGDLDMSPGLFEELSTLDTGEIPISWHFMNKDWSP